MKSTCILVIFTLVVTFPGFSQSLNDWCGNYSGQLQITTLKGNISQFPMQLVISPADSGAYNWTIIYGDSLQDVRDYKLLPPVHDYYVLDEQNGILLGMSKFGDQLISLFEVAGNQIWISYKLTKKGIVMSITSSVAGRTSGGIISEGGEEIPLVTSYTTTVSQTAVLKRR